ncbi:MAG: helix-turn-helix domain-containing protein [Rubrivivax sp.]|nr:helix-turn-helix domain-containing protein [Rubrivivax sp.]
MTIDSRTQVIEAERSKQAASQPGKSLHSNSVEVQRQRILDRLRIGPATTLEIRAELDVLAVGARIFELRRDGHDIGTISVTETTACGQPHRVARYFLRRGSRQIG